MVPQTMNPFQTNNLLSGYTAPAPTTSAANVSANASGTTPADQVVPYINNNGSIAFTPKLTGGIPTTLDRNYTYSPNGSGGVNYFLDGVPITNTQYRAGTGEDTDALEASIANGSAPSGGNTNTTGTGISTYQNEVRSTINPTLSNILNSSTEAARNTGLGIDTTLRNYLNSQIDAQEAFNNEAIQAEMAKKTGNSDILKAVGQGIEGANRMLANNNAGSSSAAEELVRIYNKIGAEKFTKLLNDYGLKMNEIATGRAKLKRNIDTYKQDFINNKEQVINGIVASAAEQLNVLNNALVGASLSDRVDIEAEKAKVKAAAQAELAQYDQQLDSIIGQINADQTSDEQNRTKAQELLNIGQSSTSPFNYTTEIPTNWVGQAPAGSTLPIYVKKRES